MINIWGSIGGVSHCTAPTGSTPATCKGGYAKPSWQTGTGVPNDGKPQRLHVQNSHQRGFAGGGRDVGRLAVHGGCSGLGLVSDWTTVAPTPTVSLAPVGIAFPATKVGSTSASKVITVKSTGRVVAYKPTVNLAADRRPWP